MEYRMYCLVLKHLNPIQKGVQSAHSIVEYANKYSSDKDYKQWATKDKTLIMLNGGTSPELENIVHELNDNDIQYAVFTEPDLNGLITSICFIASEEVFNDIYDPYYQNSGLLECGTKEYRNYIKRKIITSHRLAN